MRLEEAKVDQHMILGPMDGNVLEEPRDLIMNVDDFGSNVFTSGITRDGIAGDFFKVVIEALDGPFVFICHSLNDGPHLAWNPLCERILEYMKSAFLGKLHTGETDTVQDWKGSHGFKMDQGRSDGRSGAQVYQSWCVP